MANEEQKHTNGWDVLIHLINFLLNLLKIEKVACLAGIYLLYRDFVLSNKIGESVDVTKLMIDANILNSILNNDNTLITVLACVIAVLFFALLWMCFYVVPMHRKEIDRLTKIRSELMHGNGLEKLQEHNSSIVV